MEWKLALDATIAEWEVIRDNIGKANPVDLVTEINAVCELCDKASHEADQPGHRCRYCIVFGTDRGCRDLRLELTQSLLDEDWESSRAQVDEVLRIFRETATEKRTWRHTTRGGGVP